MYRYRSIDRSIDRCFSNTGPVNTLISHHGIQAVHAAFTGSDKTIFEDAYVAAYGPCRDILQEIYDEVASGNEIRSVNMAVDRHDRFPMGQLDGTYTWTVGSKVRAARMQNPALTIPLDPFTSGTYVAMMMAQIDVLLAQGHCYSEVANESVIESTDSLNPYMHARGVAYMVDNCSTTARLGSRKWAPRFDYILTEQAFVTRPHARMKSDLVAQFHAHPIHKVLDTCLQLRPTVDIKVE
jgi:ketol-acid reductoisomerase